MMKKQEENLYKQCENKRMHDEAELYHKEEEQKKHDRIMKNKNHLEGLMKQKNIESKMFAKTGVAIVKNTTMDKMRSI